MSLAIFDLDNTLLNGDSDYLWGQFLVEQGIVDGAVFMEANARFYEDYRNGCLDIARFLEFALRPLAEHEPEVLLRWRASFVATKIVPILLPAARALIDKHREVGHLPVIITATNRFVTEPIAELYGIEHLIATTPEFQDGRYTGRFLGIPCFRDGKVARLRQWLEDHGQDLEGSWFYSDSHNDLPLLSEVTHPVAVDPDPLLARHAEMRGWPIISLRQGVCPETHLGRLENPPQPFRIK
ncbi:HAD family hydrolase [Candidatus Methylocalor cossyra]|uniref:Phosphoserine phosphatase n=1 Tax=Candidatus Methylocalor cossyra TaxID=3108543 RepID=A0ABM9NF28_9GAMM